jgi:hypothetical protein
MVSTTGASGESNAGRKEGNAMKELWIMEFRRRYMKGDRYQPDYLVPQHGGESPENYATRAKRSAAERNRHTSNFIYRARKFKQAG